MKATRTPVEKVLDHVDRYEERPNGFWAICPAHDDSDPSLHVEEAEDGSAIYVCRVGCSQEDVLVALEARGLKRRDLFAGSSTNGHSVSVRVIQGGRSSEAETSIEACTLEAYAETKGLPAEWLQSSLRLSDRQYNKKPAVRIPYFAEDGQEAAVRIRTALQKCENGADDRFRWRSGSKAMPYGLERLEGIRKSGWVVLVEGESDQQTLLYHKFPALGIPGANTWKASWAEYIEGIEKVYAVVEPDEAGEKFAEKLAKSLGDRLHVVRLREHKDPSGLYLHDRDNFKDGFREALRTSTPWSEIERERREAATLEAWAECGDLAYEADILEAFAEDLHRAGVAGETRVAKFLYLIVCSRLLPRPANVVVKGPSSGGKSYLTERVLGFFPEDAYYANTAMSDRALVYDDEPLSHRMLVIFEASGMESEIQAYLIRSLLSEGHVSYVTVEKTSEGMKPMRIQRDGPTGLMLTTTAVKLHPENETRMISLTVTDTQEQTARVMAELAKEKEEWVPRRKAWHALQRWLEGAERRVTIPYSGELAKQIPPIAVRLRRDFGQILTLIRAHALLHQVTRARDAEGRVIASLEDYVSVRSLVADLVAEGIEATVPKTVREVVRAVGEMHASDSQSVTITQVAKKLRLDRSAASRRVRSAEGRGYLRNLEDNRRKPSRLVPGDPMPSDIQVLPTSEDLERARVQRRANENARSENGDEARESHGKAETVGEGIERAGVQDEQEGYEQTYLPSETDEAGEGKKFVDTPYDDSARLHASSEFPRKKGNSGNSERAAPKSRDNMRARPDEEGEGIPNA